MRRIWLIGSFVWAALGLNAQHDPLTAYPTFLLAAFTHEPLKLREYNPLPIVTLPVTKRNFYGEIRYNYDMVETTGIYGGRMFTPGDTHTIIPQAGILLGDYRGASFQLYYIWAAPWFEINFQNQYSFSVNDRENFYYNWSDIQFRIHKLFRVGASVQLFLDPEQTIADGGIYFAYRKPAFILAAYSFNFYNSKTHYVVLGVQWKLVHSAK